LLSEIAKGRAINFEAGADAITFAYILFE
jgi:hypothetical protein